MPLRGMCKLSRGETFVDRHSMKISFG